MSRDSFLAGLGFALLAAGCGGTSPSSNNITTDTKYIATKSEANATMQGKIVDRHNYYRKLVGVDDLIWDDTLGAHAQTWANYLAANYTNEDAEAGKLPHAKLFQTDNHSEDDWNEGENIARSTTHIGYIDDNGYIDTNQEYNSTIITNEVNGSIDVWASEAYYYEHDTPDQEKYHYTQIVWQKTTKVGCGKAISKVYTFNNNGTEIYFEWVVCRYSPAGNIIGEKPYDGAPYEIHN